jgi:hypothetical protein
VSEDGDLFFGESSLRAVFIVPQAVILVFLFIKLSESLVRQSASGEMLRMKLG